MPKLEDRKTKERDFHNRRELARLENAANHDAFYSNRRFYSIAEESSSFSKTWISSRPKDSLVLVYCCGTGEQALEIAKLGYQVIGIDIADTCIESARAKAVAAGLSETCTFVIMDAENTAFAAGTFDAIVATGCLHHLDLTKAYKELARLPKSSGEIICTEALRNNPIGMLYRRLTPHLRTAFEVEHILSVSDIRKSKTFFHSVEMHFFHFTAIFAVPLRTTSAFHPVLNVLNRVDRLLARLPLIQCMAWQCIFILKKDTAR